MRRFRPSPGTAGWIAVGIAVAVAEVADSKTMSTAFGEAVRHPVVGPVVCAVYAVVTAHLFGLIPEKYDLLHLLATNTFAKGREGYGQCLNRVMNPDGPELSWT